MTATANRAIWQDACGVPGVIRDNSVPTTDELGDHKVLVKPLAWAINPCDHMLQDQNLVSYPLILGCDVAGTVEAVAPGSTAASHFRVGDRVFGFTANNGFQEYTTLDYRLMSRFPDTMAYREAVVFGLCSATTALLMFDKDYLNLEYPRLDATKRGQSLLVWGGSSAIGSNAIQLATAAGFDVIATCSTNNFEYVRNLGAVEVFDYKDPDVTEKLTAALDQTTCAGVFMAAGGKRGNAAAYGVARRCKQKVNFVSSNFAGDLNEAPEEVNVRHPAPGNFKPFPDCWFETRPATFGGYLSEALANGAYKVAPPPLVVNTKGLEGIQEAVDLMCIVSEKGQEGLKGIANYAEGLKGDKTSAVKLVVERS